MHLLCRNSSLFLFSLLINLHLLEKNYITIYSEFNRFLFTFRLYWLHKAVQFGMLIIILRVLLLRNPAMRGAFFSLLSTVLRICRLIVWRLRIGPVDDRDQRNTKRPLSTERYLKVQFVLRPRCSASSTIKRYFDTHRLAFSMLLIVDE